MKYQREKKTRPAPWTQTPAAQLTRAADDARKRVSRMEHTQRKKLAAAARQSVKLATMRKPVRARSAAYEARMKQYRAQKDDYLRRNKYCGACIRIYPAMRPKAATQIHHQRGRLASLLLDERFWTGTCQDCHDWIHNNVECARKIGLIAQPGEWNKPV